jgi:hypothetical protein
VQRDYDRLKYLLACHCGSLVLVFEYLFMILRGDSPFATCCFLEYFMRMTVCIAAFADKGKRIVAVFDKMLSLSQSIPYQFELSVRIILWTGRKLTQR